MKRPPEMTRRQFQSALKRNGFKQVLMWVSDITGQVPGTSWGMTYHASGKPAYRYTLARVIRERRAQIERDENSINQPGFRNPDAKTIKDGEIV